MSVPDLNSTIPTISPEIYSERRQFFYPREITYMGSWHVARLDLVKVIIGSIEGGLARPELWDPTLPFDHARHNIQTSWLMVVLGLLAGLRPFELARIRRDSFDLRGGWLTLRGKPHAGRSAFRRLPLLPEVLPFVEALFLGCPLNQGRSRLGLINLEDEFKRLCTQSLDGILIKAAKLVEMDQAPDFYSLRHRFRTDMLRLGMPEHFMTYLMGHESKGVESCNIYLERSLCDIVPVYCDRARRLAVEYGIHLEPTHV